MLLVKEPAALCCGLIGREDTAIKFCASATDSCVIKKHKTVKVSVEAGHFIKVHEDMVGQGQSYLLPFVKCA